MIMMLNRGAHFCALLVHTEETRTSLVSVTLITDSFESGHQGGNGLLVFKADNSTPSPAHADEAVYRNAGRVVPEPLLCVADWRERGGAVCRQMIWARS